MVECFSVRQTVSRIYLFRFKGRNQNTNKSGDNSREDTPVPISNTEVKLLSADDTWREAAWESRTLPVSFKKEMSLNNRQHHFFPGKYGFPQSERRCRREGNRETRRIEPARYMDVAGFLNIWLHGQAVKTPPFHGGNPSSILGGVTR